ncbi:cytochrome c oxidase cbb3-type subunit 4 [Duganella sacchari]|uniref:Cytochrome c oxidase cbb3-type subunit 4 n=1 Tax=Duganella sacchari TaxID=551987 RepID=A0A1M7MJV2_9BURK|nr:MULTISPECIES: cbb3-type cytochrome c oxidase subunit 3 [Duganella]MYM29335.1 CcoQ/FixQ family Cbb3-type cytochrome c oxidase assembly chaperone [Duganella sp. CY15W]SHM91116.1 cytochrome c oxidase cbb3-type subunit 4 [Duganella sacchari]
MALQNLFDHASSVMTVISFITFAGILWWAYVSHKESDFASAARLPFADEEDLHHG